ncbi:MAG TPA: AI-2E family transporter [Candidatus Paceibacterota bacterium]|nr:AI-2E family transporter [Candidatus Paceibacterota bacterium]
MASERLQLDISTSSILRTILIVLLFVFLYALKEVIIIFLFALVLASAISPFANWLDEKRFPRILGVLLLYLSVLGLAVFVSSLIVPYISDDISRLTTALPEFVQKVVGSLEHVQNSSPQYFDFLNEIENILEGFSSYLQQASQSIVGLIVSVFGGVFSFFAILVISFYLSVTRKGIETFLGSVVPEQYESYVTGLWKRVEKKVGKWFQGQLLLGLIVGLMVYIGLSLLNIKFALILSLLMMVLELVPMVGPVLGAIPAAFLAFLQSPSLGLWVIILYVVVQQLENHILVPLILGKTLNLNPVVVIIALLVGQTLAGIPGMILAVPVATIIVEMLDDVARQKESRRSSS